MLSIIALPGNFVASTTASMADLFTDFSPLLTLIIGILLGAVVIDLIINAIRHR